MEIISESNISIPQIATLLQEGKTIVYPTETCYGLGCDATNEDAVEKIFFIKQRQQHKSVLILMANVAMAKEYVIWNEQIQYICDHYWPGPVTVVAELRHDKKLPAGIIAPDGSIAFRISSHPLPVALSTALNKPLVSTSANISSHASPYDAHVVFNDFKDYEMQPDIIIDAGILPEQAPSTIVHISEDGNMNIVRQGGVVVRYE